MILLKEEDEIKNIPPTPIEEILKSDDKDKNNKVREYFKDKYKNFATDILSYLSELAIEQKDLDHPIFKYVDNLYNKKVTNVLYLDYLSLLGKDLDNGNISPDEEWLYDKSLYNEIIKSNIYKMKAFLFLKNKRNVRDYGLYKKGPGNSKMLLSIDDIRGKNEREVREFLDSHQSEDIKTDTYNSYDLRDYLKDNGMITDVSIVEYLRNMLKKAGTSIGSVSKKAFESMISSAEGRLFLNQILRTPIKDGDDKEILNLLLSNIKAYVDDYKRRNKAPRKKTPKSNDGISIVGAQPFEGDKIRKV